MGNIIKRRPWLFYGLNVGIPVLAGSLLYLLFRRETFLSEAVYKYIAVPEIPVSALPSWLVRFLRNFASDILWAYALSFAVSSVLRYSRKTVVATLVICLCFSVFVELMQKVRVFRGTFDILDIILEGLSICLALVIIIIYEETKNEKSSQNP